MNLQNDDVKAVIRALSQSENAMSLDEFVQATKMTPEYVYRILQFLVTLRIFVSDNSFARSEVGHMVYFFAGNDEAQVVAAAFEEENRQNDQR